MPLGQRALILLILLLGGCTAPVASRAGSAKTGLEGVSFLAEDEWPRTCDEAVSWVVNHLDSMSAEIVKNTPSGRAHQVPPRVGYGDKEQFRIVARQSRPARIVPASPDKRRPVLLLTRDAVIETLNEIIAVPVTRTIRGLSTEVLLSPRRRHAHRLCPELRPRWHRAASSPRCRSDDIA